MSRLLAAALVAVLVGCASPPPSTTVSVPDVAPGQPFTLEVGEMARVGDRLVRLVSVEDGRCPQNVECVWAGEARVAVEVAGRSVTLVTPSATPDPSVPVSLWEVTPYPGSSEADEGEPVRVTLEVLSAGD